MFARFVTPATLETDVTRAIDPRLLFAVMTAADARLPAELRFDLAAAAEDFAADVLTAALRLALLAETAAFGAFARLPTPLLALVAAAGGTASAAILPPVADFTACAEATLASAPTLVCIDRASGATRANEARLPLTATTAGA